MWYSFWTPSHSGKLCQHQPFHCHSQSGMKVTVWRPGHLSSHAYPGVLLQHTRDWSFSTSFLYLRSRYAHSYHTASFINCSAFTKGSRFLNMVMSFVLHPLSHYNSITKPRARFLLSLLEHLIIDFPSHFILSIIDVHLDSTSYDKLIFPSAIARILRHFSVPLPTSDPFTFMRAIDYATVKCSEAQFRSWQTDLTPSTRPTPSCSARSTSTPTSSTSDVSLGDIMV